MKPMTHTPHLLFWKALIGLVVFDLALLFGNFALVRRIVCKWRMAARASPRTTVEQVCDAVDLASVCYPKRVMCLQRASLMTCLLRSHGVTAEMVLGAQKLPFEAHAWVEVGGRAINERKPVQLVYSVWDRY